MLAQLQQQRNTLQQCIDRLTKICSTSIIRQLPSEIIEEITLVAIGHYDKFLPSGPDITDIADSPVKFTHITSRWRAIVLASPRAWSHIVFPECYSPQALRALKVHLDRSKTAPLRIYLRIPPPASIGALEMVMSHSDRWYDVDLRIPGYSLHQLQRLVRHPPTRIRRLCLTQVPPDRNPFPLVPLPEGTSAFFTATANLQALHLINIPNLSSIQYVPWNQLTCLCISFSPHPGNDETNLLRRLPNIVNLSIFTLSSSTMASVPLSSESSPIYLNQLLEFHVDHSRILSNLDLTLPALTSVDVNEKSAPQYQLLSSLITRSYCSESLTTLTLRYSVITASSTNTFRLTPNLSTLNLLDASYASDLKQLLARLSLLRPDGVPVILPYLQRLTISLTESSDSHPDLRHADHTYDGLNRHDIFFSMLRSRWYIPPEVLEANRAKRLESFVCRWNTNGMFASKFEEGILERTHTLVRKPKEGNFERFTELREAGMVIKFELLGSANGTLFSY